MLDTKEKPVEGKVTEPAKQWRNLFVAKEEFWVAGTNKCRNPGDVWQQKGVWPSKEIAEEKAGEYVARQIRKYDACLSEYLGAFPVTP